MAVRVTGWDGPTMTFWLDSVTPIQLTFTALELSVDLGRGSFEVGAVTYAANSCVPALEE